MISEDAKLMEQIALGDELATRQVVSVHLNYVINIAFRILHDYEEAHDIAQDCFLKLWKQSKKWQANAKISTWLFTVTRNACLDRIKKKKPILSEKILELTPSKEVNNGAEMEDQEQNEKLNQVETMLSKLSENYRLALTTFYFENLKLKEAAKKLNLTEDAYESLLRRARTKLKSLILEVTPSKN